jgi:hypothetical protein
MLWNEEAASACSPAPTSSTSIDFLSLAEQMIDCDLPHRADDRIASGWSAPGSSRSRPASQKDTSSKR